MQWIDRIFGKISPILIVQVIWKSEWKEISEILLESYHDFKRAKKLPYIQWMNFCNIFIETSLQNTVNQKIRKTICFDFNFELSISNLKLNNSNVTRLYLHVRLVKISIKFETKGFSYFSLKSENCSIHLASTASLWYFENYYLTPTPLHKFFHGMIIIDGYRLDRKL